MCQVSERHLAKAVHQFKKKLCVPVNTSVIILAQNSLVVGKSSMPRLLTLISCSFALLGALRPFALSLHLRRPNFSRLQNEADVKGLTETASKLDIAPPWNAPSWIWALAWKIHAALLPLLHAFDTCNAKDSFVNLYVLWWKAISGNRRMSRTFDGGITHDLLPSFTRSVVAFPLCYLYPNLHHQNVAMRTVFLDYALKKSIESIVPSSFNNTHVVILGGGFDSRSLRVRLEPRYNDVKFYEFDLPQVTEQKRKMLERFLRRRPSFDSRSLPMLVSVDLNDIDNLKIELERICTSVGGPDAHLIFLSEAVMLYLKQDNVPRILSSCVNIAKARFSKISYCFADRFIGRERVDACNEEELVARYLHESANFELREFRSKPGKARQMGIATYSAT